MTTEYLIRQILLKEGRALTSLEIGSFLGKSDANIRTVLRRHPKSFIKIKKKEGKAFKYIIRSKNHIDEEDELGKNVENKRIKIFEVLKKLSFEGLNLKYEKELELYILGIYKGLFYDLEIISSRQKSLYQSQIDIFIKFKNEEYNVGIEIKFDPDANEQKRFLGQLWDYSNQVPWVIGFILFSKKYPKLDFHHSIPKNSDIIVRILNNKTNKSSKKQKTLVKQS